ncbi:MAG: NnrU family protein [Ignavibacteriaceae bacterium]
METNYLILISLLILWCIIHSLMIDNKFIKIVENMFKSDFRYYRLFYNIFAIISLLPIISYSYSLPSLIYFQWEGYFIIPQACLLIIGLILLIAGLVNYNFLQFLGIQQIIDKKSHTSLSKDGALKREGILNITRHPWYTAFIIILWARELNSTTLIINIIFSIYLVIGTYLEEKKLKFEFGEAYNNYQRDVSMLFPIKWIKSKFNKTKLFPES